jgi:hypothetical protein
VTSPDDLHAISTACPLHLHIFLFLYARSAGLMPGPAEIGQGWDQ